MYIYIYITSFDPQCHLMSCVFITSILLMWKPRNRLSNLTEAPGMNSKGNKPGQVTSESRL